MDLKPVVRALKRNLTVETWEEVPDPRNPRGVRHSLPSLLNMLVLGLVTNRSTLRDVERLIDRLPARRALGIGGPASDTTLYNVVRRVDPSSLRAVVVAQVRAMERNKQLEPAFDFPCSLVAIDGKALGTDPERLHPESHRQTVGDGARYVLKALRAVHITSAVKPILDQRLIPKGKGERYDLWSFLEGLRQSYGGLARGFTFDAGFWSQDLVTKLSVFNIPYIFGLKGNAGSPYRFAQHELGVGTADPAGGWEIETTEKRGSRLVRRQLARKQGDVGTFGAVCSVWRQRTTVLDGEEVVSQEDRFFATSFPVSIVSASQALAAIRAHWGIENDSHWTMDAILDEDTHTWVARGHGREVLTWLRILAYNLLRLFRCRSLRPQLGRRWPWRAVVEEVHTLLLNPDVWRPGFT